MIELVLFRLAGGDGSEKLCTDWFDFWDYSQCMSDTTGPLANTVMVRSYGLYHHNLREELARCREILGQPPLEDPEFLDWQTLWQQRSEEQPDRCPDCGKRLITLETVAPVRKLRNLPRLNKEPELMYDKAA